MTLTTPPRVTCPNAATTAATTTTRKIICALSLDIIVSSDLRQGYWGWRQKVPNVQYFTNEMVAQAITSVNPEVSAEYMHLTGLFLTAIDSRN